MATRTLESIGKQIRQLDNQLSSLQTQFQNQKEDLDGLHHRRRQLQSQLKQVESEILQLMGDTSAKKSKTTTVSSTKPEASTKSISKPRETSKTGKPREQPVLRVVVTDILRKARKPIMARELANRVLATGYQTKSKDFLAVVYDLVSKSDAIEIVPNQGCRLTN